MISIVIPVYNNWKYTKVCLDFFEKNKADFFEVIIIDNASTDETEIGCKPYSCRYFRNSENTGFGAAVNKGYKESKGDVVLFLNNDIMFGCNDVNWLKQIEELARDNTALIGPTGGLLDSNFNFVKETDDFNGINYISGWFLCANKKVFDSLIINGNEGPFDAKTFFAYFEDADLSFRASEKKTPFLQKKVPIFHIGRQTSKTLNLSSMYIESKKKFTKKWGKR